VAQTVRDGTPKRRAWKVWWGDAADMVRGGLDGKTEGKQGRQRGVLWVGTLAGYARVLQTRGARCQRPGADEVVLVGW